VHVDLRIEFETDTIAISQRSWPKRMVTPESIAGSPYPASMDCSWVCTKKPMGESSYLPLPENILNRNAVVNPQNNDRQCFKWAILAKHVTRDRARVGANYTREEHRYDFSTQSTHTPVSDIKLFEKSNPGTTVNLYGIRNCEKNKKSGTQSAAYPLRIADEEKTDHFDLLLTTGKDHVPIRTMMGADADAGAAIIVFNPDLELLRIDKLSEKNIVVATVKQKNRKFKTFISAYSKFNIAISGFIIKLTNILSTIKYLELL
jgi:hypothetical protein